jgi:hypothetical protein
LIIKSSNPYYFDSTAKFRQKNTSTVVISILSKFKSHFFGMLQLVTDCVHTTQCSPTSIRSNQCNGSGSWSHLNTIGVHIIHKHNRKKIEIIEQLFMSIFQQQNFHRWKFFLQILQIFFRSGSRHGRIEKKDPDPHKNRPDPQHWWPSMSHSYAYYVSFLYSS